MVPDLPDLTPVIPEFDPFPTLPGDIDPGLVVPSNPDLGIPTNPDLGIPTNPAETINPGFGIDLSSQLGNDLVSDLTVGGGGLITDSGSLFD